MDGYLVGFLVWVDGCNSGVVAWWMGVWVSAWIKVVWVGGFVGVWIVG